MNRLIYTGKSRLLRMSGYCRAPKREANKRRTGEVLFDLGVRTYVYLSVTLGKDCHIHTVMLGKDHHVHIRIYACAHGHQD